MYYNKEIKDIEKELGTTDIGLTNEEALKRIKKYGKNVLPTKKKDSVLKLFLKEFKNPITGLLLVAIIASILVHEYIDALAILFIVLVDAVMGTYQENKANNTIESLTNLVKEKSIVMRDGHLAEIDSSDLTIGDLVMLESGDKISADLRVVDSHNFLVDESILTGESIQVGKTNDVILKENIPIMEQHNMLFAGTSVASGRASAIVVRVGVETEIGHIAESINTAVPEKSPLTIRVEKFSKEISMLLLVLAVLIMFLLIYKDVPYDEVFLSVIALAVSAMPEGLPLALTMALTIASNKMAKKNVVVRELNSVETLGSCTVIASDKTGTMTVNEQTAKVVLLPDGTKYEISGVGYNPDGSITGKNIERAKTIALLGMINNEAVIEGDKKIGDSIDLAFLILAKKTGVTLEDIEIVETIPYESENQFSAVFYKYKNKIYCTAKGSLEVIKNFSNSIDNVDSSDTRLLDKQNQKLAKSGYRVIALANGIVRKKNKYTVNDIKNLTFMGMVGFIDPVREEVRGAIEECKKAGIKVLMITGDHPLTAFKIGADLNLAKNYEEVATGSDVEKYLKKGDRQFDEFVKSKRIFARVTPIQKLNIVESLKRQKEFVAVTGDGVNDAPALKSANIGIAMGSGTDIAASSANMVIIDDNFTSIVAGVKEGRIAYSNIRQIIFFLISCGLAEVFFFCLSILFNMPMPLIAIQLLWLNVVTDGVQDMALSFEKGEDDCMDEPPRDPEESLFDRRLGSEIVISGITIGLVVFIVWYVLLNVLKVDLIFARSCIMALMVFMQNVHAFNCRSERKSVFKLPFKNNKFIYVAFTVSILLQIVVSETSFLARFLHVTPIPFGGMLLLFVLSTIILFVVEAYKEVTLYFDRKRVDKLNEE